MVQRKFDGIHDFFGAFQMGVEESVSGKDATMIPLIMNDDALGDPMSLNVHPEHASWSELAYPNCYPDSEVRSLSFKIQMVGIGDIGAVVPMVDFDWALISCAFPEDLDAIDELSGATLKSLIEVQSETTDRQCYPLWSGVDLSGAHSFHANVPGLTGGQVAEGVNWDTTTVKDQFRYGKLKGLLKKTLPIGIKRTRLNLEYAHGGTKMITIRFIPSNAKFINPYTFLGFMIKARQVKVSATMELEEHQPYNSGATTVDAQRIQFAWSCRFNERNPEFHMAKV